MVRITQEMKGFLFEPCCLQNVVWIISSLRGLELTDVLLVSFLGS